jgi:hypothetical protein
MDGKGYQAANNRPDLAGKTAARPVKPGWNGGAFRLAAATFRDLIANRKWLEFNAK